MPPKSEGVEIPPRTLQLIDEALQIEAEDAREAGALGYVARVLAQVSLPYTKQPGAEFTRKNGDLSLSILAPSSVGLPYGSLPRLLLAWLVTEAVKTKSPHILLGHTLSSFMGELDLVPTGGRWGSIGRLKEQMKRLFSSAITCTRDNDEAGAFDRAGMMITQRARLWWDPKRPAQASLWQTEVILGTEFFEEVTRHPVPVDMRALKVLKQSPLALDLLVWLSYRMSYLRQPTSIPWPMLEAQFGSNFGRSRDFRAAVLKHLPRVLTVYQKAQVEATDEGLRLKPSPPHVKRISG